ncbi:MAG: aspartate--ammonia ligase [Peptostreptococcaceae bacterium]
MEKSTIIPKGYKPTLNLIETEVAIKKIKDFFESNLAESLNLTRVSAPIFVKGGQGINDNLNGVERVVSFDAMEIKNSQMEIVQSLAKWKRMALKRYKFEVSQGLYTDMNAIRRDEELDNLHSLYVDQWDWEKIIRKEDRTEATLKAVVKKIYEVFKVTESYMHLTYNGLTPVLPNEIKFVTSQQLEDMYPTLTSKEREHAITKEFGAVFIMKIGGKLKSGEKHDGRSPDYDDWELNGDILFWSTVLDRSIEVSSMGIRVDEESLAKQLDIAGCNDRRELEFHKLLLNKELPYTIGGGIGQSRICMFFLKKAHVGEVQSAVWTEDIIRECEEGGIVLL